MITLRLVMRTPGGVSAPESARAEPDRGGEGEERTRNVLPLRREPGGSLHIPGATVAGSLRRHCLSDPRLEGRFGSGPGEADAQMPSEIRVLGCVLLAQPETIQRTRTAIDRHRGAPANRTLHTVEQFPAGTEFDIVLRWNDPPGDALDAFLDALQAWTPRIGRGSALGAGRCEVVALGRADYDLSTVDGLADWLAVADGPPRNYPEPAVLARPAPGLTVHRSLRFAVVDAIHIGTGSFRTIPGGSQVATIVLIDGRPMVPGSSLKGVLRSRAEYICRVSGVLACSGSAPPTCMIDRPCPPCRIFGRAASADGLGARRAALAISDAEVTGEQAETRTHVALDRFTGGGRDKLLFTDDVVVAGRFVIRMEELAGPLTDADTMLVDAAIADLDAGLIGIGARTTAGYGTVRCVDPTWVAPDLSRLAALLRAEAA